MHILILLHVYYFGSDVIGSIDFQEFFHSTKNFLNFTIFPQNFFFKQRISIFQLRGPGNFVLKKFLKFHLEVLDFKGGGEALLSGLVKFAKGGMFVLKIFEGLESLKVLACRS